VNIDRAGKEAEFRDRITAEAYAELQEKVKRLEAAITAEKAIPVAPTSQVLPTEPVTAGQLMHLPNGVAEWHEGRFVWAIQRCKCGARALKYCGGCGRKQRIARYVPRS
jgi:hypothetical protein